MNVKMMQRLDGRICDELEKISNKTGAMSTAEIDSMHKLIVASEKLMKIDQMNASYQQGYSQAGRWNAMGYYGDPYDGDSYANQGEHYVRGHYSMADGADMMRDRMNGPMYDRMSSADRMSMNDNLGRR